MTTYVEAATVADAVAAMADGARPIAGGTDLVVGARQGKASLPGSLVGIHRIAGLDAIGDHDGGLRLGALVTHQAILTHPAIRSRYTGLADGSANVGSHATRVNGTIGGNVMNASPAMDTGAPLLCFEASATLRGPAGSRQVALAELWTGPGQTSAALDELLTAITLPRVSPGTGSAYVRLQYRRQMEIAVVGAAAVVTIDDDTVTDARIAIASLSPVIMRVAGAEEALTGRSADPHTVTAAAEAAAAAAAPISDVRASAEYRRAMAAVITRRAINTAIARAGGTDVPIPASDATFGS